MPRLQVYVGAKLVLDEDTKKVKGFGADHSHKMVDGGMVSVVHVKIKGEANEEPINYAFNAQTGEEASEASTKFGLAIFSDHDVVVNFGERVNPEYVSG